MYTYGFFREAEDKLLPQFITEDEYESCLEKDVIHTLSLDVETRMIIEAYLYVLGLMEGNNNCRYFMEYADELGSPFKEKCLAILNRYKAFNTSERVSKLSLLSYVIEQAPYFFDKTDPLWSTLLECVQQAKECASLETKNSEGLVLKDVLYFIKHEGESVPDWVMPLTTYINLSHDVPTDIPEIYEIFSEFPVYYERGINVFLAMEIRQLLDAMVDQMVLTIKGYDRLVREERVSDLLQRYVETIFLEKKITSIHELINVLEEVVTC